MPSFDKCSLMKEIKQTEDTIKTLNTRIEVLEEKLKSGSIRTEHEETLRKELSEFKKLLAKNQEILKHLHKDNRKSFLFASALCLLIFICWMLYQICFVG